MKYLNKNFNKILNFCFLFIFLISFAACAFIDITDKETCKNHANININLKKYITSRYANKNLIRLGIFPFSVPANFTAKNLDRLDYGTILAQKLQPTLLALGLFSTSELLEYSEWSGKKQEFFSDNLLAIEIGKNIGLDFIVVGYLAPQNHIEKMTLYSKVIDVNSGMTVFYGETVAYNNYLNERKNKADFGLIEYKPSDFKLNEFTDSLMQCHGNFVRKNLR